jgi:cytochrome b subunit of formate dehydrogenase
MSPESRNRIIRFNLPERLFHLLLIFTFLLQSGTGLARLYIKSSWGQKIAWVFGGYESCLTIHKYAGIIMIIAFLAHLYYVISGIEWKSYREKLLGEDSIIPHTRDLRDFLRHIGWFAGLNDPPRFERWGYWEKFDYWAVFWGIPILGITGLILAYPLFFTRFMSGWGLNIAIWIHRIEAVLAMCHIFIIHFFIAHLRRSNFPMDRTMFEGSAALAVINHEKPAWISRLENNGKLDGLLVAETTPGIKILFYVFGYACLLTGAFLLIGGLLNIPYITW